MLKALDTHGNMTEDSSFPLGSASILNAASGAEANLKILRGSSGAPIIPPEKLSYLFGVWRMEGDSQNNNKV